MWSYIELFEFNMLFASDAVPSGTVNEFENGTDFNEKWPGLNLNLLIDIYSVHKALMFGQFKFKNYTKKEFMSSIQEAEKRVFGEAICSPIIGKHESSLKLSFHPSYVINDDIFEVMAFHFAVSLLVNRLAPKDFDHREMTIRSIVVPMAVISIYDSRIAHKSSIEQIGNFVNSISPPNLHYCAHIKSNIKDIESMTQCLTKLLGFVLLETSAETLSSYWIVVVSSVMGCMKCGFLSVMKMTMPTPRCSICIEITIWDLIS